MNELTGQQRRHLRGLAHGLQPSVQVGQRGLTDAVVAEVDRALERHELIKVKLAGDRDERRTLADTLAGRLEAHLAGTIGSMAIFYRRNPDSRVRKVALP